MGWLVAASALLVGAARRDGHLVGDVARTEIAPFRVPGTPSSVELDVGAAPVEITGGAAGAVEVRRTEEFAFGRRPSARRASGGVLRIVSRCPATVLGALRAGYRIAVPDNVLVNVRTTSGRVAISGAQRLRPGRDRSGAWRSTASAASRSSPPRRRAT